MKIALVSDLHITSKPNETGATLDEQRELLDWIGVHAAGRGVDAFLVGGDIYDSASTPEERNVAITTFENWSATRPVVGVAGNHDRKSEMVMFNHLGPSIQFFDAPATIQIGNLTVHCLPWATKANLAATTGLTSRTELDAAAGAAMCNILTGFRVESDKANGPVVLLAHAELGAAVMDSGQPLAGRCDIELSEGDLLDCGADVVCLGHIHKRQILGDGRIIYPGSYRPTSWGETEPKGFCIIDVERGEKPVIEFVEAPNRKMATLNLRWDTKQKLLVFTELFEHDAKPRPCGLDLRIKYEVDESNQHEAAAMAAQLKDEMLADGARAVKLVPEVVPTTRVRSEAISKAKTTEDRLRAYWDANDSVPAREQEIVSKLGVLESEVST